MCTCYDSNASDGFIPSLLQKDPFSLKHLVCVQVVLFRSGLGAVDLIVFLDKGTVSSRAGPYSIKAQ